MKLRAWSSFCHFVLAIAAVEISSSGLQGQGTPVPAATPSPGASAAPTKPGSPLTVSLGDEIWLDFPDLVAVEDLRLDEKKRTRREGKEIGLYLDGLPMGLRPQAFDWQNKRLLFRLERTEQNKTHWRSLFQDVKPREVSVAVAIDGEPRKFIRPGNERIQLRIYAERRWIVFASVLIACVLLLLVIYGAKTNLLRDASPRAESEFKQGKGLSWFPGISAPKSEGFSRPPFSLGRFQMAVWFFLITAAFLFLWLVLGERNSLNPTALTLLGISLSTGLAARVIDAGKAQHASLLTAERKQLAHRKAEIENRAAENPVVEENSELKAIESRIPEIDTALRAATVQANEHKSEGLIADLLSDQNGISLHRLQMLVWTILLAMIFVVEVSNKLEMPEFDSTFLVLMGLSSGAFVCFKVPEKKTVPEPA